MTKKMTLPDPRAGLAADAKRRNRISMTLIALMLLGGLVGFLSAMFEAKGGGFLEGIPPSWAILVSILLVGGICLGAWFYHRSTDELERYNNMWASAFALNAYLLIYAVWYLWWRGGLVSQPTHEAMFVIAFAAMMIGYGFKKLRP